MVGSMLIMHLELRSIPVESLSIQRVLQLLISLLAQTMLALRGLQHSPKILRQPIVEPILMEQQKERLNISIKTVHTMVNEFILVLKRLATDPVKTNQVSFIRVPILIVESIRPQELMLQLAETVINSCSFCQVKMNAVVFKLNSMAKTILNNNLQILSTLLVST